MAKPQITILSQKTALNANNSLITLYKEIELSVLPLVVYKHLRQ